MRDGVCFSGASSSTGIGLSTVKAALESGGGRCQLRMEELSSAAPASDGADPATAPAHYKELLLELPAQRTANSQTVAPPSPESRPASPVLSVSVPPQQTHVPPELPTNLRVLLADDHPVNLKIWQRTLLRDCSQHWACEMVRTADEALERAKASSFDLIILDKTFCQRQLTGIEIVGLIREHERQHPDLTPAVIIICSAEGGGDGAVPASVPSGCHAAWGKSLLHAEQLRSTLSRLLRARYGPEGV